MLTEAVRVFATAMQRKLRQILIGVFLFGLLFGACVARLGFFAPISLDGSAVSPVGLITVLMLPLLISYGLFYFSKPHWILPLCFCKAFMAGYFGCGILLHYGSAGWLLRFLLTFSDNLILVVLCWYWLRHIEGNRFQLKRDTAVCTGIALLIGIFDIVYISPFLALVLQG